MEDGGLKKVTRPGGGKDEEDEENEFTSFLDQKPDSGVVLADIDKVLEETAEPQMTKEELRRHQDRFGFCCGIEW